MSEIFAWDAKHPNQRRRVRNKPGRRINAKTGFFYRQMSMTLPRIVKGEQLLFEHPIMVQTTRKMAVATSTGNRRACLLGFLGFLYDQRKVPYICRLWSHRSLLFLSSIMISWFAGPTSASAHINFRDKHNCSRDTCSLTSKPFWTRKCMSQKQFSKGICFGEDTTARSACWPVMCGRANRRVSRNVVAMETSAIGHNDRIGVDVQIGSSF